MSAVYSSNFSQNISISLCYSHGKGFEEFMCFGEGLHADCVDRERVIGKRKRDYTLWKYEVWAQLNAEFFLWNEIKQLKILPNYFFVTKSH